MRKPSFVIRRYHGTVPGKHFFFFFQIFGVQPSIISNKKSSSVREQEIVKKTYPSLTRYIENQSKSKVDAVNKYSHRGEELQDARIFTCCRDNT